MPAFVKGGPDIPERLLQAHEENRVAFFCGAGISAAAQLPNFKNLVERLYKSFGVPPNDAQQTAIDLYQYDRAIELLERTVIGSRTTVREEISRILTPDPKFSEGTVTHESLLTLSQNRDGCVRLVTTNFDRLFEFVVEAKNLEVNRFTSPALPVPKKRWNGLIYLHGLLQVNSTSDALEQLVISSGDFGRAYLTERWASRFVSELFRNFQVCFIGYSINDPVIRYMTDALAADRVFGENVPEIFAFGSCTDDDHDKKFKEWTSKNVTPILYNESEDHLSLNETLKYWAQTYRDGVGGKKMIVAQHASTPPLSTSKLDFAVGRLLWALTDRQAAEYFAKLEPVPPLKWLDALAENFFHHEDLVRFGVSPDQHIEKGLKFSFVCRPTPYKLGHRMKLADAGYAHCNWDDVMIQLGRWLLQHLDDPKLILWLAREGGQLSAKFTWQIQDRLLELDKLQKEDKQKELADIKKKAPRAIPRPKMRILWQLLLSDRLALLTGDRKLLDWSNRYQLQGLTQFLRMELVQLLTPRISIYEPFDWGDITRKFGDPENMRDIVEWELVLSCQHVHDVLRDITEGLHQQDGVPELLQELTTLLRDALDLKKTFDGADFQSDLSYIDQPSISAHAQNSSNYDWTFLIELTRDAWLTVAEDDPNFARIIADVWWQTPYPLFKRLSFFAASHGNVIPTRVALKWLLSEKCWWFWSVETRRETLRLLKSLSRKVSSWGKKRIETAILKGPPPKMYRSDVGQSDSRKVLDYEMWIRLAKLKFSDIELSRESRTKLEELSRENPIWELAPDDSDEFTVWVDKEDNYRRYVTSPQKLDELMAWLLQPKDDFFVEDDWSQRCGDDFDRAFEALSGLANIGRWPIERWREALQVWRKDEHLENLGSKISNLMLRSPERDLVELALSLSAWLEVYARKISGSYEVFFDLCQRILCLQHKGILDTDDDLLANAINHPVGRTTQAVINLWYRQNLEIDGGLDEPINSIFTNLCDTQNQEYRHGRILLAMQSMVLFRVDSNWAKDELLPLFNWRKSQIEARSAWAGFLWSPRWHDPLLLEIKRSFLDTADNYQQLGRYGRHYAEFLTFAALDTSVMSTMLCRIYYNTVPLVLYYSAGVLHETACSHIATGRARAAVGDHQEGIAYVEEGHQFADSSEL